MFLASVTLQSGNTAVREFFLTYPILKENLKKSCYYATLVLVIASIIIIICNSYIAPNPIRLAQSTSQFKTRMDIRINT